jgi:hypothetical protein
MLFYHSLNQKANPIFGSVVTYMAGVLEGPVFIYPPAHSSARTK